MTQLKVAERLRHDLRRRHLLELSDYAQCKSDTWHPWILANLRRITQCGLIYLTLLKLGQVFI